MSANAETVRKADALAFRRLLTSLWLGFGSYAASLFLIIPAWTGLARDAWLIITLLTFAGAVTFLLWMPAAYTPPQGPEPKRNISAPALKLALPSFGRLLRHP